MSERPTLDEQREEAILKASAIIEKEVDWVDIKPYSHNIISLALGSLAKEVGNDAANDLIDAFNLEDLGWSKQ